MAIFSRRIPQRLIDQNAEFLSESETKRLVVRLNGPSTARGKDAIKTAMKDALSAEWEIVILNSFSKLGNVRYEPTLGGRNKPDLFFTPHSDPHQELIADVLAVSDEGLEEQYPVEALYWELIHELKKHRLNPNFFFLDVRAQKENSIEFRLPGLDRHKQTIFGPQFINFLKSIEAGRGQPCKFELMTDNAAIRISYNPGQTSTGYRHPSFTEPASVTQNRIYSRLEDKASQLRKTGFPGPRGIILCDTSCCIAPLGRRATMPCQ